MSYSWNGTAYELSGRQSDPVVVLIHGLGLNRHMWRKYVPALSRKHQVLTYDLSGHGETNPVPCKPSLKLFAKQLNSLLDQLGIERCTLVGFSLGGMINRRFAMDFPECTSTLVILNSPHERQPEEQRVVEERVKDSARSGPAATIETSLERWFTIEYRSTHTDAINQVRTWIASNDPVYYTQCRQVLACGVTELIRPQPPIAQPTLVITCENDSGSTPAMSRGIAAEIDGAQLVIVPRLQHLGLLEDPEAFINLVVRFLSEASS